MIGAKRKAEADGNGKQMKISDIFTKKVKKEEPEVTDNVLPPIQKNITDSIMSLDNVHESWLPCFTQESSKPYFRKLEGFLTAESSKGKTIFPESQNIFSWATLCPVDQIKVIILGQDPYHDHDQAHGLAFSVKRGIKPPPSLRNIWKELEADVGIKKPSHGCLEGWARQGVLLLNTSLTVRAHEAASHAGQGWETFTDAVIEYISQTNKNVVFMLWGGHAQKRAPKICKGNGHLILQSAHPSPLSAHRGFFGCKHFSKCNEHLANNGHEAIDWSRTE